MKYIDKRSGKMYKGKPVPRMMDDEEYEETMKKKKPYKQDKNLRKNYC